MKKLFVICIMAAMFLMPSVARAECDEETFWKAFDCGVVYQIGKTEAIASLPMYTLQERQKMLLPGYDQNVFTKDGEMKQKCYEDGYKF
jgi:hypothetical protein